MKSDGEKSSLNIAIRTIRSSTEEKHGKPLDGRGVFVWWLVVHVGTNLSRMKVGTAGLTHYEIEREVITDTHATPWENACCASWTKMP